MASSKVMVNTSTTNPDLPCPPNPIYSSSGLLLADLHRQDNSTDLPSSPSHPHTLGSMNMDDLLKNIYATPPPPTAIVEGGSKSVEEVWKEIVSGDEQRRRGVDEGMTLEDFLSKAGAVREEDVRGGFENVNVNIKNSGNSTNGNGNSNSNNNNNNQQVVMVGPGSGSGSGNGNGGGGRGKRRAVEEPPLDKATQQKQRRMIKNRESAARSRERKQAYTVELESLVTQLEEENASLLQEEVANQKLRLEQLMQTLIPIVEKRRPRRVLRRVNSGHW